MRLTLYYSYTFFTFQLFRLKPPSVITYLYVVVEFWFRHDVPCIEWTLFIVLYVEILFEVSHEIKLNT